MPVPGAERRGVAGDLPARSPAERWPADSCVFCFKATCDFCVALRPGHPSFFFKLGRPVQHLSKLVASVGRQENKVTIRFLIIFQPLPPPHPRPFCNLVINLITVPAPGVDPTQEQELCQEGLAPCVLSGFSPRPRTRTRATLATEANPIVSCGGFKR